MPEGAAIAALRRVSICSWETGSLVYVRTLLRAWMVSRAAFCSCAMAEVMLVIAISATRMDFSVDMARVLLYSLTNIKKRDE
jgi:hypothetical protein